MKWPRQLMLIRHGRSLFNELERVKRSDPDFLILARIFEEGIKNNFQFSDKAVALALKLQERYTATISEAEIPLTKLGQTQAYETGRALSANQGVPDVIFVSPYTRARQTLEHLTSGWPKLKNVRVIVDERIRERNIGTLEIFGDPLILYILKPIQARLSRLQGPYHYRWPQGESIVDVQSRNRQWFQTLTRDHSEKFVLVISHGLTISSIRGLLERWTPEEFIQVDHKDPPRNCSLTIYRGDPNLGDDGKLVLKDYNKILYQL